MSVKEGAGTDPAQQSGGSTQDPERTAATFTEADMAKARESFEHKAQRQAQKAAQQAAEEARRAVFEKLGIDHEDDLEGLVEQTKQRASAEDQAKQHERQAKRLQSDYEKAQGELERLRGVLRNGSVERTLLGLAEKHNGHAKSVLAHALLEHRVQADDEGRVFVIGDDGEPDDRVSVEDYVKKLLADNGHLVRSVETRGAGSRPATERPDTAQDRNGMSLRDKLAAGLREAGGVRAVMGRQ